MKWLEALGMNRTELVAGSSSGLAELGKVRFEFSSGEALELCVATISPLPGRQGIDSVVVHTRDGSAEAIAAWLAHNQTMFGSSFQDNVHEWQRDLAEGRTDQGWTIISRSVGGVAVELGLSKVLGSYSMVLTLRPQDR